MCVCARTRVCTGGLCSYEGTRVVYEGISVSACACACALGSRRWFYMCASLEAGAVPAGVLVFVPGWLCVCVCLSVWLCVRRALCASVCAWICPCAFLYMEKCVRVHACVCVCEMLARAVQRGSCNAVERTAHCKQ